MMRTARFGTPVPGASAGRGLGTAANAGEESEKCCAIAAKASSRTAREIVRNPTNAASRPGTVAFWALPMSFNVFAIAVAFWRVIGAAGAGRTAVPAPSCARLQLPRK